MALPAQPNKSVLDAVEVIMTLAAHEEPLGSRELARALHLEATRANRLLKTLSATGIAHQTPDQRYGPGPGMHVLSAMSMHGSGLLRAAEPSLRDLTRFGSIVALGVLWRSQVAYLFHWRPGITYSEAIGRVGVFEATHSSIGIALLAEKTREEIDAIYPLGQSIPGYPSRDSFYATLDQTLSRGIAVIPSINDGSTRAAAIRQDDGAAIAAIAISGDAPVAPHGELDAALMKAAQSTGALQAESQFGPDRSTS